MPGATPRRRPRRSCSTAFRWHFTEKKGFGPYLAGLSSDQAADADGNGVKELIDGWHNPIHYTEGRYLPDEREYELRSAGEDGKFDTEDDVVH